MGRIDSPSSQYMHTYIYAHTFKDFFFSIVIDRYLILCSHRLLVYHMYIYRFWGGGRVEREPLSLQIQRAQNRAHSGVPTCVVNMMQYCEIER